MYVVRVLVDGRWALAKPCDVCQQIIKEVGIKHVYYSGAVFEESEKIDIWCYDFKEREPLRYFSKL